MMMVGLKQKRSGELFEGSYEGRSLLLGKSWGSARRVYRKKKNRTAVDLKGGRRREQETNKDLSGLGLSCVVNSSIIIVVTIILRHTDIRRSGNP